MNNIGEQINQVINNLSQKLGIAVDKLYPALRKQAYIDGVTSALAILVGVVFIISVLRIIKGWIKKKKEDEGFDIIEDDSVCVFKIIYMVFAIVFALCLILCNFSNMITALFNPDYYILQNIFNQINNK